MAFPRYADVRQDKRKKPHTAWCEAFSIKSRRRPTFPPSCPGSIIGAGGLNFRVRDGNGCFPSAIATGTLCGPLPFGTADDHLLANSGKLFLAENPPRHQVVKLLVGSVTDDSLRHIHSDPRESCQFLDRSSIQVELLRGGSIAIDWTLRRRIHRANLPARRPTDSSQQDHKGTNPDQYKRRPLMME